MADEMQLKNGGPSRGGRPMVDHGLDSHSGTSPGDIWST